MTSGHSNKLQHDSVLMICSIMFTNEVVEGEIRVRVRVRVSGRSGGRGDEMYEY